MCWLTYHWFISTQQTAYTIWLLVIFMILYFLLAYTVVPSLALLSFKHYRHESLSCTALNALVQVTYMAHSLIKLLFTLHFYSKTYPDHPFNINTFPPVIPSPLTLVYLSIVIFSLLYYIIYLFLIYNLVIFIFIAIVSLHMRI